MNGILNVLKPPGMTSYNVVSAIKRLTGVKKVGHTGTLDPGAAGVLPICIGKATKLFDYIADKKKEYIAGITFGITTDTMDSYGTVLARETADIDESSLKECIRNFIGNIKQVPPAYSALKIHGRKYYELAREGIKFDIKEREVIISNIEVIDRISCDTYIIKVNCSKGTYIRSLCNDIGDYLKCGAYMSFLIRTSTGPFHIEDSYTLDEIKLTAENGKLNDILLPVDYPLADYPEVNFGSEHEKELNNGCSVPYSALSDSIYRVYCDNIFFGLGQYNKDDKSLKIISLLK